MELTKWKSKIWLFDLLNWTNEFEIFAFGEGYFTIYSLILGYVPYCVTVDFTTVYLYFRELAVLARIYSSEYRSTLQN